MMNIPATVHSSLLRGRLASVLVFYHYWSTGWGHPNDRQQEIDRLFLRVLPPPSQCEIGAPFADHSLNIGESR